MTIRNWVLYEIACARNERKSTDGRLNVLSVLKIMKKVGATSLIVERRDETDEFGMLLFSDVAKGVIAKKGTNVE